MMVLEDAWGPIIDLLQLFIQAIHSYGSNSTIMQSLLNLAISACSWKVV